MGTCSSKGRDCIESNYTKFFNCSTTCVGVYAYVQWSDYVIENGKVDAQVIKTMLDDPVKKELERIERKIDLVTRKNDESEDEKDKEKLAELISEYRKFKKDNVRHFRFTSNATTIVYGKHLSQKLISRTKSFSGEELPPSILNVV